MAQHSRTIRPWACCCSSLGKAVGLSNHLFPVDLGVLLEKLAGRSTTHDGLTHQRKATVWCGCLPQSLKYLNGVASALVSYPVRLELDLKVCTTSYQSTGDYWGGYVGFLGGHSVWGGRFWNLSRLSTKERAD